MEFSGLAAVAVGWTAIVIMVGGTGAVQRAWKARTRRTPRGGASVARAASSNSLPRASLMPPARRLARKDLPTWKR